MKLSLRYYKTNLLIATILALAFGIDMSFELIQNYFDRHTDFILRAPTNAAMITSLLFLYDRYLWRYPVLNKLIYVPNLNGRYVGCIEYEWDRTSQEMECAVEIIQTASSIQIHTYFKSEKHENTYSQSLVEDIRFEKGQHSIYFFYFNAGTTINSDLDCHHGANYLRVILNEESSPKRLTGNYFTNRSTQTKGKIEVNFESRKLEHKL
jgi:hypothetical protein